MMEDSTLCMISKITNNFVLIPTWTELESMICHLLELCHLACVMGIECVDTKSKIYLMVKND